MTTWTNLKARANRLQAEIELSPGISAVITDSKTKISLVTIRVGEIPSHQDRNSILLATVAAALKSMQEKEM